jgi:hypothetical protein
MKKILVTLLAFLYITSSCEATVYLHYCMGKPVSFSFHPEKSMNCNRCGMKKTGRGMGCCKDEQKIIKTDKNQKLTDLSFSTSQQKKFITIFTAFRPYFATTGSSKLIRQTPAHGPPGTTPLPVYLVNCLLLI